MAGFFFSFAIIEAEVKMMLNTDRVNRVLNKLQQDALLVMDPYAIDYLCGKHFEPGERFLGLLLRKDKEPVLYVNALFRFDDDLGLRKVYYDDTDDVTAMLRKDLDPNQSLGVDKIMPARFLLPLMEQKAAASFALGSLAVDQTRAVKDRHEIELMRASSHVNDLAMEQFKKLIHEGVTEVEVADQMLAIYKKLGASGYSFDPIVAFGDNAADPHHMPDDTVLEEGDIVLFDVGCVVNGYCSDMTRTFFYKQYPDKEAEKVYNLVREANEQSEEMLKPGVEIAMVDKKARDIITNGGYGEDFTHRLGHFIGLQDHEYGDVSSTNHNLEEAGMIHSIEPGIYHPGIAGVRIEDLVLITEDGYEVLNHYPHDIEVIG